MENGLGSLIESMLINLRSTGLSKLEGIGTFPDGERIKISAYKVGKNYRIDIIPQGKKV